MPDPRAALLAVALALVWPGLATPARAQAAGSVSGLPVPRYASLKSDRVNARKGPGLDYPIAWVYERVGLPVEVVKEFENWREVRDSEGSSGWVLQNLLSGRRTALVLPWEAGQSAGSNGEPPAAALHAGPAETSSVLAYAEAGSLASILDCDRAWCRVSISGERGYIQQEKLWGVYKDEVVR